MKMTEVLFRCAMLLSCCTGVFYLSCANSLNEKNPSACESLANALGVDYGKETTGTSGDESAAEDYKTKITTGADVPDDAWVWGRIAPSGYVVLSFSAKEDKAYRIFWNDSANGTDEYSAENGGCQVNIKGTFGSDPTLSGHYWYSESKNEYWTFDTSSGYTEGGKISAKEKVSVARDRTVWLRVGLAENSPDGCFSIAVLENDEPVSLSEERVFGATTNAVTSLASPLSYETTGTLSADSTAIYYFAVTTDSLCSFFKQGDLKIEFGNSIAEFSSDYDGLACYGDMITLVPKGTGIIFMRISALKDTEYKFSKAVTEYDPNNIVITDKTISNIFLLILAYGQ